MTALSDCLRGVIEHFHIERLHLVAHSMGGVLALTLANSGSISPLSLTLAEGNLTSADAFMSSRIADRSEAAFVKRYELWVTLLPSFMTDETEQRQQSYAASLQQSSAVAMYRASKSCAEWSQSEELSPLFARLLCPRAYVVGEKTRQRRGLPAVALSPPVTLFEISGQGHFMMGNTEAFYIPLARWVDSLDRP
jgi:pimeloyl-ACP methyl ester carboxylesterase